MGQIRVHIKFLNCDPDEKLVSTQIFGVKLLLTEYSVGMECHLNFNSRTFLCRLSPFEFQAWGACPSFKKMSMAL